MDSYPRIFEKFGIEIEYMIVDRDTLAVKPVADKLLTLPDGRIVNEIEDGDIAISNELALHIIELKTAKPVTGFSGLAKKFSETADRLNSKLEKHNAVLMQGAAHPSMDPAAEAVLWPHGNTEIYGAYDRIFGCRSHGWVNLQSVHLNISFCGDDEFARLHSAVRLILPIIPAIASASPLLDGKFTGYRDTRLAVYSKNQSKIPSIAGDVIPEPVFSKEEYEKLILGPIYRDIAPFDPEKILSEEWLNSRGAIARFDRSAVEIRLIDAQESPRKNLAAAAAVLCGIMGIDSGIFCNDETMRRFDTGALKKILMESIRYGEDALISDRAYLSLFGIKDNETDAASLWKKIIADSAGQMDITVPFVNDINFILENGTLAARIEKAVGPAPSRDEIASYYRRFIS